ncbi:MAG: DUF4215 domain-containing protein [Myxococcota bacterium]|nr:DUF4215 domain-containing protein [Myxococcota bacterium]
MSDLAPRSLVSFIAFVALLGCSGEGVDKVQSSAGPVPVDLDRGHVRLVDAGAADQAFPFDVDWSDSGGMTRDAGSRAVRDAATIADVSDHVFTDSGAILDMQPVDALAIERGFDALMGPEPIGICGDGVLLGAEQCDDGNVISGDGCDSLCTVENWSVDTGRFTQRVTIAPDASEIYAFTVDGAGTLDFTIGLEGQCIWPNWLEAHIIRLADEHVVAHWPAHAGDHSCTHSLQPLEPGLHELRFSPDGPEDLITFQLEMSVYQFIGAAGLYPIRIADGGDERFEFLIDDEQRWEFVTTGVFRDCEVDSWMDLYRLEDDRERRLDFDNDGGQGTCSRLTARFLPGRYAIQVRERFNRAIDELHLRARTEGVCGDGIINVEEECDEAELNGRSTCSQDCRRVAVCGNGEVELGETCDDQNQIPGDGCDENCQQEILCGNAVIDPGEDCDDGNFENGDGCDFFCTFEFTELVRGKTLRRGHFPRNGADWYEFTADGPGRLETYTFVPVDDNWNCRPSADTLLSVFIRTPDGDDLLLHENDNDPNNAPCSYLDVEVGTGQHFIRVAAIDNFAAINDYSLSFRFSRDITGLRQAQGGFVANGSDLYTFRMFGGGRVEVRMIPFGGPCEDDVELTFFRQRSSLVIPAELNRINGCMRAAAELEPGLYDVSISRNGGGALEAYTLEITWPE